MLNWLCRYAPVEPQLPIGAEHLSILDVGCGPVGLSEVLPNAPFVGFDIAFTEQVPPSMFAVCSPAGPLPFPDGAFDVTICLDVIEHIAPLERKGFVSEVCRVTANRVLIACPCDEGEWGDAYLREQYAMRGAPSPDWLDEHAEHGLPPAPEIARLCATHADFSCRPWPMVNGWLTCLIAIGDVLPELAPLAATEFQANGQRWVELLRQACFGESARKGYILDRHSQAQARVPPGSPPEGVLANLRCLRCGETHELVGTARARCRGCGARLAVNDHGVWDLAVAGQL